MWIPLDPGADLACGLGPGPHSRKALKMASIGSRWIPFGSRGCFGAWPRPRVTFRKITKVGSRWIPFRIPPIFKTASHETITFVGHPVFYYNTKIKTGSTSEVPSWPARLYFSIIWGGGGALPLPSPLAPRPPPEPWEQLPGHRSRPNNKTN